MKQKFLFRIFLALALCAPIAPVRARTSKYAAMAALFKALCTLTGELKKTHEYANSKLTAANNEIEALTKTKRQLDVFAAIKNHDGSGKLATAIAATAAKLIQNKKDDLLTLAAKGLTATAKAALAAGHATEFFSLLERATTVSPASGECLLSSDSGVNAAAWTGLAANLPGCDDTPITELTVGSNAGTQPAEFDKVTANSNIADPGHYTQAHCKFFSTPSTTADNLGGIAYTGNKINYAAGAISLDSSTNLKINGFKGTAIHDNQPRFKEAKEAIAALDTPTFDDATAADATLYNALIEDETFLAEALQIIANISKKGRMIKTEEASLNKIKGVMGTEASKFTSRYLNNMRQTPVPKQTDWDIELTSNKLLNIGDDDQYAKLLHYYNSRHQPKVGAATCQPETATPKDDAEGQKICEKFHDKPKECPDKTCTYDTKAKKCNPIKPVEGAATPGAGETKTTDKCTAATTHEDFAEVTGTKPEGKAAVYGWIDKKCKDCSFLVNKKLSLMLLFL
uniref:Variant surface glycoprotein 1125.455 n=1 Tax=Trypanosoma brucei TaxID=5691 RepID=A0A1J0R5Y6_9TRYP|nr:variant surface glycoprotein 1125.455 [Trypanosoma brucei]